MGDVSSPNACGTSGQVTGARATRQRRQVASNMAKQKIISLHLIRESTLSWQEAVMCCNKCWTEYDRLLKMLKIVACKFKSGQYVEMRC